MNIFIENRAWFSGCHFNENTIKLIKDSALLNNITANLPFLNSKHVTFKEEPITIYSHLNAFEIIVNKEAFDVLMELVRIYYKDESESLAVIKALNVNLIDYKIRIFDNGFINITSQFQYNNLIDITKIDNVGDGIILINECVAEMIVAFVDILVENKVISNNEFYYFGVPKSVSAEIHKCSSYLVTQHFLTKNEESYKNLTVLINKDRHLMFGEKNVAVTAGNYLLIWNYKNSDFSDLDFIPVDFISNCETVLYSVSSNSSRKLLRLHNLENASNSKESRLIISSINETLLSLNYLYYYMSIDDRSFIKTMADLTHRSKQYKLFKDTENILKYSTESLEIEKNQKNAFNIQIILAIFTCITLFSVINDILAIINFSFSPNNLIFKVLFLSVILAVVYFVLKYIKKMAK